MSANKRIGMKGHMQKLCYVLFIHWVLLQLPESARAASSGSLLLDYGNLNNVVQETIHLSTVTGRHLFQASPSPAPVLLPDFTPGPSPPLFPAPTPFYAPGPYASGPAPMPLLFPSDPPVTIPYSPAPGALTIPAGTCSVNLEALEPTIFTTATDCSSPLAVYVGVAMCCPQIDSLLRIVRGQNTAATGYLGLNSTDAEYCYSEIADIISAKGTNSSLLCSVQPSDLSVGSCPVKTVQELQLVVNTSSLLEACESIDPLTECSAKTCQNEIGNATLQLAGGKSDAIDDCQSVLLSWVASHSPAERANTNLRLLTSCTVNRECPLVFNDTSSVARACNASDINTSCCTGLSLYMQNELQTQMLVTNQQAYTCAEDFATDLQRQNVTADIYTLCKIHLSDFSLQAHGAEGCLLSSSPTDINITTGVPYFICDLNDNIQARWPGSNDDAFPLSPLSPLSPITLSPSPAPSQPSMGTSSYTGYGWSTVFFTVIALAVSASL